VELAIPIGAKLIPKGDDQLSPEVMTRNQKYILMKHIQSEPIAISQNIRDLNKDEN
jgi:hypothetical protein